MATASTVRSLSGAEAGLSVERVSLLHYRNYRQLRLELEPGSPPMNVLTGPNGSGKTNFLEALSYLAPGRGLRGARLAEVSQRGAGEPWAVAAVVSTPGGRVEIGTGLSQAPRDQTP
ncbi:MAG: AAA family ATPase, partial [Sphingomonadales bacterium]